jgi:hypothetical protein
VAAAGYSDEQTHHWLIGGSGAITHNQILHIAATWSVTGDGKLAETRGNQTRKAHWNTQGTKPAPMQVRLSSPTVPATPPTIILESAHSQLSVPNGIMRREDELASPLPMLPQLSFPAHVGHVAARLANGAGKDGRAITQRRHTTVYQL